ncbi:MAG: hypothetical protein M1820_001764 [Bogoriella megaspora]|nr:MAG: hypothetical protein M1820_001764 [Bogoriella megaspora]
MSPQAQVHVINKTKLTEHLVIPIDPSTLPPLNPGSIRVRSAITSLTATNLAYAKLGTLLHWWDAYPVPPQLPAPHNDQSAWGIVPCWGYGEVLESSIDGISPGCLIWGYWPTASLPFDLKLNLGDARNHWWEVSDHRKDLMPLYNRYDVPDPTLRLKDLSKDEFTDSAWQAVVRPIWGAGWALNNFCFGPHAIHPSGVGEWSKENADLSAAVIVNLSASGKTARAFTDGLVNNRQPNTGPVGLLAISRDAGSSLIPKADFPTKAVSYSEVADADTVAFIAAQNPSRVVVVDFGGKDGSLATLLQALEQKLPTAQVVVVGVGIDVKPLSLEEMAAQAKQDAPLLNGIQMNTSPLYEAAKAQMGAQNFFDLQGQGWQGFVERGNLNGLKLVLGEGIEGDKGIEGGWERVCKGNLGGGVSLSFKIA